MVSQDVDFIELIRKRNTRKKGPQNINLAVAGETGIGKSWTALKICEIYYNRYFKKKFPTKNIIFTISEFLKLVESLPKYSWILFDDSGLKYSNKKWWEELNQILGYTLQSFRYRIINVVFTIPIIDFMDKVGVNLLQAKIDMKRPGWGTVKRLRYVENRKRVYETRVGLMTSDPPSKRLIKYYDQKKHEFLVREYQTYQELAIKKESFILPISELVKKVLKNPEIFKLKSRYNARLIQSNLSIPKDRAYQVLSAIVKMREEGNK